MFIKKKGAYIACGPTFSALIYVIGDFPHFTIVSGVELDPFLQRGEVRVLEKDSLELAAIMARPDQFVYAPVNFLSDTVLPGLNKNTKSQIVEFDEQEYAEWAETYKELKQFHMPMEKLIVRIMMNGNRSYPQAKMILEMLEKKIK